MASTSHRTSKSYADGTSFKETDLSLTFEVAPLDPRGLEWLEDAAAEVPPPLDIAALVPPLQEGASEVQLLDAAAEAIAISPLFIFEKRVQPSDLVQFNISIVNYDHFFPEEPDKSVAHMKDITLNQQICRVAYYINELNPRRLRHMRLIGGWTKIARHFDITSKHILRFYKLDNNNFTFDMRLAE